MTPTAPQADDRIAALRTTNGLRQVDGQLGSLKAREDEDCSPWDPKGFWPERQTNLY